MKYRKEKKVNAVYSSQKGNPFLEAMPELLSKKTFFQNIQNDYINESVLTQSPEERRRQIIKLSEWFYPLDYMYRIYDMLYHSILSSYQSQTTVEFVKQLNRIYKTFQNQELCSTSETTISRLEHIVHPRFLRRRRRERFLESLALEKLPP